MSLSFRYSRRPKPFLAKFNFDFPLRLSTTHLTKTIMLPPITIPVPKGTVSIYISALSLADLKKPSSGITITWSNDGGNSSASSFFTVPSLNYVLSDNVTGLPIMSVSPDGVDKLSISFNINTDLQHQHSVSDPVTNDIGFGCKSASMIQISAYESGDTKKTKPTTVTIQIQGKLVGTKGASGASTSAGGQKGAAAPAPASSTKPVTTGSKAPYVDLVDLNA